MSNEIKCGRAYAHGYGLPDEIDDFREHIKTCKDCNDLSERMRDKYIIETISSLIGI